MHAIRNGILRVICTGLQAGACHNFHSRVRDAIDNILHWNTTFIYIYIYIYIYYYAKCTYTFCVYNDQCIYTFCVYILTDVYIINATMRQRKEKEIKHYLKVATMMKSCPTVYTLS